MLSREEVKDIALLARVGLSEEEEQRFEKDLSSILGFFDELEKLPTEEIEGIGHITGRLAEPREDRSESMPEDGRASILKDVPETKDGYVKVRSVF